MQVSKNGIPIDIPKQRKKAPTTNEFKAHNDFYRYKKYATLEGFEDGFRVTATAPIGHPDFKDLLAKKYRIVEKWERSDIA